MGGGLAVTLGNVGSHILLVKGLSSESHHLCIPENVWLKRINNWQLIIIKQSYEWEMLFAKVFSKVLKVEYPRIAKTT